MVPRDDTAAGTLVHSHLAHAPPLALRAVEVGAIRILHLLQRDMLTTPGFLGYTGLDQLDASLVSSEKS